MCPKCKGTGFLVNKFFSACASEDCDWVGLTSETGSLLCCEAFLFAGLISPDEKMFMDPLHSSVINQYVRSQQGSPFETINQVVSGDYAGLPLLVWVKAAIEEEKKDITGKVYVTRALETAFNWISSDMKNQETPPDIDGSFLVERDQETGRINRHEYGFPPISMLLSVGATGNESGEISFNARPAIWQPIAWDQIQLKRSVTIHFLAVFQVNGQNFTYIVQEDIDKKELIAGIVQRKFLSLEHEFKRSSGTTVDECVSKLKRHFDNLHNKMTIENAVIENSWASEFSYADSFWTVIHDVVNSGIFELDVKHKVAALAKTNAHDLFHEMYSEGGAPKSSQFPLLTT